MQALIVQLSDLHIKDESNPVLLRAERIASAVDRAAKGADAILLLWTGDIAFSGLGEQYLLAEPFFAEMISVLKSRHNCPVYTVCIPGNHDCDLLSASDVRDVPGMLGRVHSLSPAGETVRHCLAVQTSFFRFLGRVGSEGCPSVPSLFYEVKIPVGSELLVVRCYNTAWLTQNPERPGQLYFPLLAAEPKSADGAVILSTFHHPYNWLIPENANAFKRLVEGTSDLVLSGHEHVQDSYLKTRPHEAVRFVEAPALFETSNGTSGFNVVVVDSLAGKYFVTSYSWAEDFYEPEQATAECDFARNPQREAKLLGNTEQFNRYLNDLGTGFTHPRTDHLTLDDLFVYPELHKAPLQQKLEGKKSAVRIRSGDCAQSLLTANRSIVIGTDKAGKTTLAKMLYRYALLSSDLTPILLRPQDIDAVESVSIHRVIDQVVQQQYGRQHVERLRQMPPARTAILFDDFHKARLTRKGQVQLLSALEKVADNIVLLVNDAFPIYELTAKTGAEHPFTRYQQFQIQEFGRVLQGELIEKWVRLGQDYVGDDVEISRDIENRERTVQALLSKRLFSSYPVAILSIMQAAEASKENTGQSAGAYGELFESLITETFRRVSTKTTEIGKKYTIVSRMAVSMFRKGTKRLTAEEIQSVLSEYFLQYRVATDSTDLISQLVSGDILAEVLGGYEFRYIYYFHYFVARFFYENMSDPSERASLAREIRRMADRVYRDDYADILVFYLYLSRDLEIVEHIKTNASRIYDEYPPSNLAEDVTFINQLYLREPEPIALPPQNIDKNRHELRSAADAQEDLLKPERTDEEIEYQRSLNDLVKLNIAFKTLYVLGQVLRSFPGVLKQEIKVSVARECYRLSLRVLSAILQIASQNLEDLRRYFAEVIRENQQIDSPRELAVNADELTIWLTGACAYGVIKRVSLAVGHEDLGETYKDVFLVEKGNVAIQVIDLAIKLDNFKHPPEHEIKLLSSSTKNYFVYSLVRELVRQYLTLFRIEPRARERIINLLKFEKRGPGMLEKSFVKKATQSGR